MWKEGDKSNTSINQVKREIISKMAINLVKRVIESKGKMVRAR